MMSRKLIRLRQKVMVSNSRTKKRQKLRGGILELKHEASHINSRMRTRTAIVKYVANLL